MFRLYRNSAERAKLQLPVKVHPHQKYFIFQMYRCDHMLYYIIRSYIAILLLLFIIWWEQAQEVLFIASYADLAPESSPSA